MDWQVDGRSDFTGRSAGIRARLEANLIVSRPCTAVSFTGILYITKFICLWACYTPFIRRGRLIAKNVRCLCVIVRIAF